jgi:hypothetical protein
LFVLSLAWALGPGCGAASPPAERAGEGGGPGGAGGAKPPAGGKGGAASGSGGAASGKGGAVSGSGGAVGGKGGAVSGSGGAITGSGGAITGSGGARPPDGQPGSDAGAPMPEEMPPCPKPTMTDPGGFAAAVGKAAPGDCIAAADGNYGGLTISLKGTADKPIVIKAANRGKAVFTGAVQLNGAEYVVLEGFNYTGGGVNVVNANHNRITRSTFRMTGGTFVNLTGTSTGNRIDHCEMSGLSGGGEGHFITPTGVSEKTRIDHNHFHDNAPSGGNGRETIRLGCCGATYDYHDTGNIVEYNLFVNCDGESEMIGMKSSGNTVRYNTIRSSLGAISFRAGRKNAVIGNYILNAGKPGAGGIRLLDEDHLVYNNYVESTATPLRVQHGDPGFPPIKRAKILFNTFVVRGAPVELGGTGHSIPPTDSLFANNLITGSGTLFSEKQNGITVQGNIAFPMGGALGITKTAEQIRVVDPMLVKMGEVFRISAGSPAVGAAVAGDFAFVMDDIDGQPRASRDVGADGWSTAAVARRGPLTPADVGPESP